MATTGAMKGTGGGGMPGNGATGSAVIFSVRTISDEISVFELRGTVWKTYVVGLVLLVLRPVVLPLVLPLVLLLVLPRVLPLVHPVQLAGALEREQQLGLRLSRQRSLHLQRCQVGATVEAWGRIPLACSGEGCHWRVSGSKVHIFGRGYYRKARSEC